MTYIGISAFSGCSSLTSVTIPNSVTSISNYAFFGCSSLASITIPNNVTLIGESAFYGCSSLSAITIPEGVTKISKESFFGCSSLAFITIPNNVTSIGDSAFKDCSSLSAITIPEGVTKISKESFFGCSGLASITIPNNVTSIGDRAFEGCVGLISVTIDNNTIASKEYYYFDGDVSYTLENIFGTQVKEYIFGESVETIGDYACHNCSSLTSITIGNNVTSIGESTFSGCTSLTSVTIDNNGIASATYTPSNTLGNIFGTQVEKYVFGGSVESIGNYACYKCSSLNSITIGNNVTSIGEYAFQKCSRLTSVAIPNSVTTIGVSAFSGCSGLTSITIPESVTSINKSAFEGCRSLQKALFGSIEHLFGLEFGDQTANPLYYAHHIFIDGEEVKDMVVPSSVTAIDHRLSGTSITSVIIPNSVTSIGNSAFSGCSSLTSVTIPNSVTSIGESTFSGCSSLASIAIPESVSSISDNTFSGCSSLTSVTIPNNVTSIGESTFSGCSSLTSVTIPNSVTSIGYSAFYGCTGLQQLNIENKPEVTYDGYDVTNDISTYKERTTQWVWDTSKNAWYVLNNKQEYEAYGVYGTDKDTWYDGKLAIVDGHEWEYAGDKWSDLGKVTDTQVVEYIAKTNESYSYIDLGVPFKLNTRIQIKFYPTSGGGGSIVGDKSDSDSKDWRFFFNGSMLYYDFDSSRLSTSKSLNTLYEWEIGNYYIKELGTTSNIFSSTAHTDFSNRKTNMYLGEGTKDFARFYYVKIYEGETLVKDFVPYFDGTTYGLWDNVSKKANMPTGGTWSGEKTGTLEYPKYYTEKEALYIVFNALTISPYAFYGCSALTSVTIPRSVTSIGQRAFDDCSGLTSVTINSNAIASNSYSKNSTLADIFGSQVTTYIFDEGVQSIGQYACYNCSSLTDVNIGNGVTDIDSSAFENCSGLTKAEFASVGKLCGIQFGNAQANPLAMAKHLYVGDDEVTNLTIPENVTSIGNYAFYNCEGLTSIYIPNSVTSIGSYAFYGCVNVAKLTLDCNNIGTWFNSLGSIKELALGNNVQNINSSAFSGCNKLETATIGDNITSIGNSAFPTSTNLFVNRGTPSLLSLWNAGHLSPYQMGTGNVLHPSSLNAEGTTQMTATIKVENFYNDMENTLNDNVITEDINVLNVRPEYTETLTLKVSKGGVTYIPTTATYITLPISPTIERTEGTASSIVAKASYLEGDAEVTSQVLTINGVSVEGDSMYLNGLKPNTNYEAVYTIKVNDEYEYTGIVNLKTDALTFQNELPKVISEGNIIVASQSNLDYAEENVGFQWRRNDWTDDFESKSAGAYLYEGMIEGYIRSLNSNYLWKFRPYYQSADGSYFYGSWSGMDPSDFSYFEPTVHTYNQTTVNGNSVEVKGYAQRGTDNVASQGFLYWKTTSPQPSPKAREMKAPSIPSDAKKVEASGTVMVASLTSLDYDTDYNYVAYITTSENETFYGDMRSFRTGEAPTGVDQLTMDNGRLTIAEGIYDLSGRKVSNNGQLTMDNGKLRKGIYIVNGKKTIVK